MKLVSAVSFLWTKSAVSGFFDYFRSSQQDRDWSGPFNGQACRRGVFDAIVDRVGIGLFIEAGTFRGVTTEFFAQLRLGHVYSIEANRRNFGYARARLWRYHNVTLISGESQRILADIMPNVESGRPAFVYLDAHWGAYLPVREELSCLFSSGKPLVVMIDDFEVPDDPGYAFDDYGEAGSLRLVYIRDLVERFGLSVFFPRCSSAEESGARRGMVVLTSEVLSSKVAGVSGLRPWSM